jgi:hypothetical protein
MINPIAIESRCFSIFLSDFSRATADTLRVACSRSPMARNRLRFRTGVGDPTVRNHLKFGVHHTVRLIRYRN